MQNLPDLFNPVVVAAILVVAVALVIAVVFRRKAQDRATHMLPPAPDPSPCATEPGFLDSSHIIDAPIIGRAADRPPPV